MASASDDIFNSASRVAYASEGNFRNSSSSPMDYTTTIGQVGLEGLALFLASTLGVFRIFDE